MVQSMKGMGIKNCDNCLNEEQTADVNDIPTIRNNVEQTQEDLGTLAENLDNEFDNVYEAIAGVVNSVKSWVEIPFVTYSEYEPYKTKILDGDILKYDTIIVYKSDSTNEYASNFIGKNTNLNSYYISITVYRESTISSVTYLYSENQSTSVKTMLTTSGNISSTIRKIGFSEDENNIPLKEVTVKNVGRTRFKIYVFVNENDLED